jgi:hypothetical protein
MVRFFTFEAFHAKSNVGSTKIRVHNLIKYWGKAELYKYGEKPDVLIFQKVYVGGDYKVPITFPAIKILDICDPDWFDGVPIKETVDAMDAITCPTEPLAEFIRQLTDKPVRVIKDRFDLTDFPSRKVHRGQAKTVVWFGYHHNASALKLAVQSIERRGLRLKVVADQDPFASRWALKPKEFESSYEFKKYLPDTAYSEIQKADICVLPKMNRPQDRFKSENKTVIAQLLGLPVAINAEELDGLMTAEARTKQVDTVYDIVRKEYDVKKSVQQMKGLINEISN